MDDLNNLETCKMEQHFNFPKLQCDIQPLEMQLNIDIPYRALCGCVLVDTITEYLLP